MTRAGVVRSLYAKHVMPRPFSRFTVHPAERMENALWRLKATDWGDAHVDISGNFVGATR